MYSENSSEGFKEVLETFGVEDVSLKGVHPFLRDACFLVNNVIDKKMQSTYASSRAVSR